MSKIGKEKKNKNSGTIQDYSIIFYKKLFLFICNIQKYVIIKKIEMRKYFHEI